MGEINFKKKCKSNDDFFEEKYDIDVPKDIKPYRQKTNKKNKKEQTFFILYNTTLYLRIVL